MIMYELITIVCPWVLVVILTISLISYHSALRTAHKEVDEAKKDYWDREKAFLDAGKKCIELQDELDKLKKRPPNKELTEFLHDMMNGDAQVKISYVNQDHTFQYSPTER